jgi:hypothetical protein
MTNVNEYNYQVQFSSEDGEFIATVAEFASLSYLDADPAAALKGLSCLVAAVVADLEANGDAVPSPAV